MINDSHIEDQEHLKKAFELGYSNAASSLSKMIHHKIEVHPFNHKLHRLHDDESSGFMTAMTKGSKMLVTTDVFGDVAGKSYLFLSQEEFAALTRGINGTGSREVNLREEFIKELDNILSASVITMLSNQLKLKMYGDVPSLVGSVASENILELIEDDFSEEAEEVYVNAICFSLENHPGITPCFIWAMDGKIISALDNKSAA